MLKIPEDGWNLPDAPADGTTPNLLSGGSSATGGFLAIPDWEWSHDGPASSPPDPVSAADAMRERAGAVFARQRAIGAYNRGLEELSTRIAEAPDWSDGLQRFDKGVAELRQKHVAALRAADERAGFDAHAERFATLQRIGLKRALLERQSSDALGQLDDQLAWYAGKAAAATNDVFRHIAIDTGMRAIDELRDAGYLFPEAAEARRKAFRGLVDGADLEAIVNADPGNAAALLDDERLFPNADADLRGRLQEQLAALTDGAAPQALQPLFSHPGALTDPKQLVQLLSSSAAGVTETGDKAKASDAPSEKTAGTPPDFATAGRIGQRNLELAMRQGVTVHDMEDVAALPEDLEKYQPRAGDSDDTIRTLLKQAQAAAKERGEDVILRIDPGRGEPQFVLRPKRSSAHILPDDVPGASFVNDLAVRLDNLARFMGQAAGGSPGGALVSGKRAIDAARTGRAADESVISMGGAGGSAKGTGPQASKAGFAIKSKDEIDAARAEWEKKGVSIGHFGPVFEDLRGNWKDGVQRLFKEQDGEIPGALRHSKVGGIDLVWGKAGTAASDGYGLAKIAKYHPEVLEDLWNTVAQMWVISRDSNRMRLESPDHMTVISLEFHGKNKTWLLTAYQKDRSAFQP